MIDITNDVPLKSELIKRVQILGAQIRDITFEIEQVLVASKDPNLLMTRKEVAERLRCDPKKIPRTIKRARVGNEWLFRVGDVDSFIESKIR